jgi:Straboviridae/Ackermannviridae/Kyanoviridae exonuclease subunit 1
MKIAVITDQHIGARNDSTVFNDYFFKFYNDIFFPTIKRLKINTIINLGDVMDRRKYINYNILSRFRREFMERLGFMNLTMHVTVGNHCDYFKNTNNLNSVNELFGHLEHVHIHIDPVEQNFDGLKILLLPWITPENSEQSLKMIAESDATVAMGHLQILGFEMYKGQPAHEGLDPKLFKKFDLVTSGHFHHKSNNENIFYLGSPYQMTFNDYGDKRGFHIFDTNTLELEFIQNPYDMFHKIYYDDKGKSMSEVLNSYRLSNYKDTYVKLIVTNKTNPYYFEQFIDRLYKENPADISVIEDFTVEELEEGESEIESEDTLTVLSNYVDSIDYGGDKNKVKDILRNLYIEANSMDGNE